MSKIKKEKPIVMPREFTIRNNRGEEVACENRPVRYEWYTYLFIVAVLILPIIHFLVFYVYLHFDSFYIAFCKYYMTGEKAGKLYWVGFENFKEVFEELRAADSELLLSFRNTAITFFVGFGYWPFSIALSYFLYKKIRGYQLFRIFFYVPSILSGVVTSSFILALCGSYGPMVPIVTKLWNLEMAPSSIFTDSTFANLFINLHLVWGGIPGSMILWAGTFARIPDSVIESGQLEGIGALREIWQIIIPLVWPTFVLLFITMWAGFFSAGGAVFLLTGGGGYGTQTLPNWQYMKVYNCKSAYNNAYTYLAAFGMMLSVLAATVSLSVRHLANKFNQGVEY